MNCSLFKYGYLCLAFNNEVIGFFFGLVFWNAMLVICGDFHYDVTTGFGMWNFLAFASPIFL